MGVVPKGVATSALVVSNELLLFILLEMHDITVYFVKVDFCRFL